MMQKGQTLIFLLLILVVTGFIAIVFFEGKEILQIQSQNSTTTSQASQPIITPQPIPTSNSIANWKVYTNTKYNYSIRYPEDTEIVECKPERVYPVKKIRHFDPCQSGTADVIFSINIENEDMTTKLPDWYYRDYKINKIETSLGGKSATKFLGTRISSEPAPIANPISIITLSDGGKTLFINNANSAAQILSTFKFLK